MPGTHPQGREEEADGAADNRYGERNGPDNIVLPAADLSLIDVGDRYRSLLPLLVPADDAEHRLVRDRYRLVDSTLVVEAHYAAIMQYYGCYLLPFALD